MSLTGRFSTLFLTALGLILAGFSAANYLDTRRAFYRLIDERLEASLAVLAAAVEVHPNEVEWEPRERVLPIGQEAGEDRLRWMVFDDRGRRIDQSRNLDPSELTSDWQPSGERSTLPNRLSDRRGRTWRVAQREVGPTKAPPTGSKLALEQPPGDPRLDLPPEAGGYHRRLVLTACVPLGPTEAALAALRWSLGVGAVGFWLVAALGCRRISRRALTPLTRMAESARGLDASESGWSLELAGTGDELDDLGRAFNDLLARLRLAYERQRRFSGDASHQLRTPLTILIGQIEVALRQERPAEEYRRVLRSALGRATQLGQIVEALLFLGRAESEAHRPEPEVIDLGGWVAAHLSSQPERTGEIVHRRSEGRGPWVRVHPALLDQLLANLLDNAGKYGPVGEPIVVETASQGTRGVLAVEDSGPGIADEDMPHVFEPFYRSTRQRQAGTPGVGLGLAIVQRIATTFGGEAIVARGRDRGCRIEVRLPAVVPADPPERSTGALSPG